MEKISMPSDHSKVIFVDQKGLRHTGVYRQILNSFVDVDKDEGEVELENLELADIYPEDEITSWDYVEKDKNPDSDIMVIL